MTDRTRYSLAALLFLVFGPTLTAALIGWIVLRRSPLAVQYETAAMQVETGIDLKIDSVEYLRWNFWKYGQLEIPHPNTGKAFVVFSELENRLPKPEFSKPSTFFPPGKGTPRKQNSPHMSITLNPKDVSGDVAILSHLLLNQFGDRFSKRKTSLMFNFDEIEILCPEVLFTLTLVEGNFRSAGGKCLFECTFNMRDNPSQDAIHFTITRQKGDSPEEPELVVELQSKTTEVPVRFLALLFPGLKSLGSEAFFHGTVRGELSKKKVWTVTFEDMMIGNADLATLGAELTPYRMSGQLQIGVRSARIAFYGSQSRFLDAAGYILVGNGLVERKLFSRLANELQLSHTSNEVSNPNHRSNLNLLADLPKETRDIEFEMARFDVLLGSDGVSLHPVPAAMKSGLVIMVDKPGIYKYHLPRQISSGSIPYPVLFHWFSPTNAEVFPLTPQTQKILPYLLVP